MSPNKDDISYVESSVENTYRQKLNQVSKYQTSEDAHEAANQEIQSLCSSIISSPEQINLNVDKVDVNVPPLEEVKTEENKTSSQKHYGTHIPYSVTIS